MAGIKLESGSNTAGSPNVDAFYNLNVNLPGTDSQAGYGVMLSEVDAGTITGARLVAVPEVTDDFRLRIGADNMIFNETFVGTALNTGLWSSPVTTMTVTVASGFANLNAGLSVASGAVAQVRTHRHFPTYKTFTTYLEAEVQFTQTPQTNNVCEWGYFLAAGTATPLDGAFFRLTTSGEFRCIINNNGVETPSAALNFTTLIGVNITKKFLIYIGSTVVHFWINNVLVAEVNRSDGQGSSTATMNLPMAFRNYNSGITSLAQVMKVGNTNVSIGDQSMAKPWSQVICGGGGHSSQGQTGGIMGTTALYANSANPVAAVPTNTTAALGSGLGGLFFETDTLAVTTDGIISSFQVPVGTAALPGKTLYVTRITLTSYIQTVIVGGPYIANWSVAYGHTAVSLATTETATSKAPRRMPIGCQPVTAAQAVSTMVGIIIDLNLDSPIVVNQGEFIQLVKKKVGTAPTGGAVAHMISIGGYFE